jgi:hypothetical protein
MFELSPAKGTNKKVLHEVRDFFMAATEACFGEQTEKIPR